MAVIRNLVVKITADMAPNVMLIDKMENLGTHNTSEITGSQKRVLETMHNLRKQGEINI